MTVKQLTEKYRLNKTNLMQSIIKHREDLIALGCRPPGGWDITSEGEKYLRENYGTMRDRAELLGIE